MDRLHVSTLAICALVLFCSVLQVSSREEKDVCPESCFCNKHSKIVYCSRRGLQRIPTEAIPSNSLQLNLNGNIFESTTIKRSNFSRFSPLEHLYMSECGIEKIEVDTFTDLRNLQWLDLSNNRIKVIEEYTFRGLSLMHLFLNGNRNINLKRDSFSGLVTTGLYLHECSLTKLSLDVFVHLNNTLKNLWLNGNELTKIPKKFLTMLVTLQHLRLGSNPFHCNCEMKWFKEMYDTNADQFEGADPPSCLTPTKWKGKFLNELSLLNFECQPPVFKNIDAVLKGNDGMLRCTAGGDPSPKLYWIQPSGLSTLYKPPVNESVHFNQAVLNVSSESTRHNDLSGSYFCVAVNEAGNMTFTFNVTWPSAAAITAGGNGHQISPNGEVTYKTIPAHINLGNDNRNNENRDNDDMDIKSSTVPNNNNNKDSKMLNILSTLSPPSGGGIHLAEDPAKPKSGETSVDVSSNNNDSSSNSINKDAESGDNNVVKTQKLFTLTELISAIVGTHLCTLLLCVILIPLYFRRRWKKNNSPRHTSSHHTNILGGSIGSGIGSGIPAVRSSSGISNKPSLQEVRYLNGIGSHSTQTYRDYFDTHGSIKR